MVYLYHQRVFLARFDVLGQIERELRVAVGVPTQLMTVNPHGGVHIHAVEVHADVLAGHFGTDHEALAIPADTTELITALGLALLGVLLVDTVIVRQIDVLP